MGGRQLEMTKKYGTVKVKKIKPGMNEIPKDCGYQKQFAHNIDMNNNGMGGDLIECCQVNCKSKWGWWFKPTGDIQNPANHWEHQNAYMSFEDQREATAFFLAVGLQSMGNNTDN